eukprot:TRINITY_DN95249_c0_g1_i1.p1 TRINITY_DN95249_c0_g1~~TRINITY_DN95249_c0_g1_i1.p1  ORF type:complete len:300 (-),score=23.66 TRINITY_DN95249_c0_g1_i1:133-1005(-)
MPRTSQLTYHQMIGAFDHTGAQNSKVHQIAFMTCGLAGGAVATIVGKLQEHKNWWLFSPEYHRRMMVATAIAPFTWSWYNYGMRKPHTLAMHDNTLVFVRFFRDFTRGLMLGTVWWTSRWTYQKIFGDYTDWEYYEPKAGIMATGTATLVNTVVFKSTGHAFFLWALFGAWMTFLAERLMSCQWTDAPTHIGNVDMYIAPTKHAGVVIDASEQRRAHEIEYQPDILAGDQPCYPWTFGQRMEFQVANPLRGRSWATAAAGKPGGGDYGRKNLNEWAHDEYRDANRSRWGW